MILLYYLSFKFIRNVGLECTETSELIIFFINLLDAYLENFYYSCEVFSLYLRKGKMILDTGTHEYLY
jgi:hypothetical protein